MKFSFGLICTQDGNWIVTCNSVGVIGCPTQAEAEAELRRLTYKVAA